MNTDGSEQGPDGEQQIKEEILQASLPFVHSLGWSQDAIAQGMHISIHSEQLVPYYDYMYQSFSPNDSS